MVIRGFRRPSTGMVDITKKKDTVRTACAQGAIHLKLKTLTAILKKEIRKGDVLAVAEVAAINAIKKTSELLFHCHPISITGVNIDFKVGKDKIAVTVEVRSVGKTGVEMEALVGVTAALLTIWDMVKGLEKDEAGQYPTTAITDIKILRKVKG